MGVGGHLSCLAGNTYPSLNKFSFNFDFFHGCWRFTAVLWPAECCALQRFPQRCAVRRNRARALIPCRDSDADFGTRLPLSLARAGPTRRVRRGVAHTAPPLPLPGPRTRLQPLPPAQSRCPTARERLGPRPCPGTALFWPGLPPALSLAQGIRGAASRSEGRAVPVCAGTGRCFRLPSH